MCLYGRQYVPGSLSLLLAEHHSVSAWIFIFSDNKFLHFQWCAVLAVFSTNSIFHYFQAINNNLIVNVFYKSNKSTSNCAHNINRTIEKKKIRSGFAWNNFYSNVKQQSIIVNSYMQSTTRQFSTLASFCLHILLFFDEVWFSVVLYIGSML